MVHAAASGAIDFSSAELLDRRWWLKLQWILNRLEETQALDVFKLQHAQHAAVLDYKLEQKAFDTHWKAGNELIRKVHIMQFPWATQKQEDNTGLLDLWKHKFGDIKDPTVKAKYAAMAKAMLAHNAKRKAEAEQAKEDKKRQRSKFMADKKSKTRKKR